ncbi:MAG: membrane protein insertase YidC [Acidimicrobiia bacterium]|nr:membrane protein insertase YidC [Acidimicrobiia bacterium]
MIATTVLAAKFWILDPLYAALGTLLAWFYDAIPSFGVAIVLLTLAVRLLTFPLTAKQARSQQQLQRVQPELKRLQAKYKGDKQKLNEEMMKFYKEHKVNPFGGCIPLFVQAPVLLVLYRLILGLTRTFIVGAAVVAGTAIAVGGAPTGPLEGATVQGGHISGGTLEKGVVTKGTLDDAEAVVDGRVVGTVSGAKIVNGKIATAQVVNNEAPIGTLSDLTVTGGSVAGTPKNVPEDSSLYRALEASDGSMESWGMDLARPASEESGSDQIPFLILIALVGASGFYQQRQLTARLPKESLNSQMAIMGKVFPLVFVVISYTLPAGVVVYFLVSNIWQISQQAFMFRNQPHPDAGKEVEGGPKGSKVTPTGKAKAKATPTAKGAKNAKGTRDAKGAKGARGATTGRLSKGAKPSKAGTATAAARPGKGKPGGPNRPNRANQPPQGRKRQGPPSKPKPSPTGSTPNGSAGGKANRGPVDKGGSPSKTNDKATNGPTKDNDQGSNGSVPITAPLPPTAGDRDKDGE